MSEIEAFKEAVERYISEHEMTPTQFGRLFARDPRFVFQIREGREPRTTTRRSVMARIQKAGPAVSA